MQHRVVGVFCVVSEQEHSNNFLNSPPGVALWHVHSLKKSSLTRNERRLDILQSIFSKTDQVTRSFYAPGAEQELDQILTKFKPNLVIFEELWGCCYLPIVQRHKCQIVYDAHNAEASLQRQMITQTQVQTRLRDRLDAFIRVMLTQQVEQRMVQEVNQVWACSQTDTHLLQSLSKKTLSVSVIPNGINISHYESVRSGHHPLPESIIPTPHTLIFTATFGYLPNAVAAQLLIEEIYPQLQALYSDCQLLLVGAAPTQLMQDAARRHSGIIVTGRVPDIRSYLALATVAIVPLLQGSGTRLKILEAFAAGRTVVSTTKGAEGINAQDGVHLLIRDGVDDLVAGVHTLWQEPTTYQQLAEKAYTLVQANYSWEAIQSRIEGSLEPMFPYEYLAPVP
jgi:polysaccharide biosynthesis protein PslH